METKLQDLNRRLTELDAAMTGQTPTSKVVASKKDREEIIALLGKDFNRVVTKFNDQIRIVEIWRTSNPEVLPLYARLPREDVHGFAGEVIEGFIKSLPNGAGASLIGVPTMGWLIQFNSYFPFKDIEELTGNFNSYLAGIAGEQRDGQIILPQGSAVIRIGQWGQATPVVRIRFGGKEYNLTLWEQPDGGLRGPYTPGITVKDINDQLQNTRIPLRMAHGDNGVLRLENTSKDGELILTLSGRMTFIDGKFVTVDSAETAEVPGGIDMNAGNMTMNEQGQKVDMQFDPAMVEEFRRGDFSGVRPVILNITPITNIRPFLGLAPEAVGTPLADAGSVSSAVRRESEV
jgi:hypothetical protein